MLRKMMNINTQIPLFLFHSETTWREKRKRQKFAIQKEVSTKLAISFKILISYWTLWALLRIILAIILGSQGW